MQQQKEKISRTVGEIVKECRLKQHKSISLISAEIGMTKSIWADLEKGIKDPQLSTIIRISEALNIKPSEIIRNLENKLGKNFSMIE